MSYAQVKKRPQTFLAWPWLPFEAVTLAAGKGGISKGRVACSAIASVTVGGPLFGYIPNPYGPMDVIAMTPEDDPERAMRWRLDAAGADPTRVHDITFDPDGEAKATLTETTLARIRAKIAQIRDAGRRVGLVYIDPLNRVRPKGVNVRTGEGARWIVDHLDDLATENKLAILLNHHTVKDGSIGGSSELVQAAREVWLYQRGEDGISTITIDKSNIGPDSESVDQVTGELTLDPLRYRLIGSTDNDLRVQWLLSKRQEVMRGVAADRPYPPRVTEHRASVPRSNPPAMLGPNGMTPAEMFAKLREGANA